MNNINCLRPRFGQLTVQIDRDKYAKGFLHKLDTAVAQLNDKVDGTITDGLVGPDPVIFVSDLTRATDPNKGERLAKSYFFDMKKRLFDGKIVEDLPSLGNPRLSIFEWLKDIADKLS